MADTNLLYNNLLTKSDVVLGLTMYGWNDVEESEAYTVVKSSLSKGCIIILCPGSSPSKKCLK